MSTALSKLAAPDAAGTTIPFGPRARLAAACVLVLGAGFQLAAFLTIPEEDDTAARLAWVADHTGRAELAKLFDVLAMPFLVGTAIVYLLLSRERSKRLAWIGGIALATGLLGLTAVQGFETLEYALAADGRVDTVVLADVVENAVSPPGVAILVMFLLGVLVGLATISVALWRSEAVPRGAVLLIPLFAIVDIGLGRPVEAHVVSFVAAVWIAAALLTARPAET